MRSDDEDELGYVTVIALPDRVEVHDENLTVNDVLPEDEDEILPEPP